MVWRRDDPEGYESDKIAAFIVPYCRGRGIDVGCGLKKAWPSMIGVDPNTYFGHGAAQIQTEATHLEMFADKSMGYVFSSHCLEHIVDYKKALTEWWRLVDIGGCLILYLPHKDFYPNIGQDGWNEDHKHDFYPHDIRETMEEIAHASGMGWDLLEDEERNEGNEYSFFQVYKKRRDGEIAHKVWQRNPGGKKRCLLIRYGAIGDIIQSASVFPLLREQGYHLTVSTMPHIAHLIADDPNIDEILTQEGDFVPNVQLGPYWDTIASRYDKVVNLCESVEAGLLSKADRITHRYPHALRHKMMNVNYLERQHDIAEVPYVFNQRFYPNEEERKGAKEFRSRFKTPVVLWAIAGSSNHKVYPFTQIVVKWLLDHTTANVVLVSDGGIGKMLQDALIDAVKKDGGDISRVHGKAGTWSVRQVLTLTEYVDCVVGPETGVLNGCAQLSVPKVLMLSHSSPENLTKHWKNTQSLQPVKTPCWPCHMLHSTWDHCHQVEETAAALCASNISPERAFEAIRSVLPGKSIVRAA